MTYENSQQCQLDTLNIILNHIEDEKKSLYIIEPKGYQSDTDYHIYIALGHIQSYVTGVKQAIEERG